MKWDELIDKQYLPWVVGGVAVAAAVPAIVLLWKRKQRIDVSKYPRDKVTLFQFPRGPWAPSLSPFCTKLETFLRMAKIPYQNEFGMTRSSKGKLPWMIYDGEMVADSQFCIKHLNKLRGLDFNSALSDEERATAWAYQIMLEDHFLWGLAIWRFDYGLDNPKAKEFLRTALGVRFGPLIGMIRGMVRKAAKITGMGRHSHQELEELALSDLKALSNFLGNKPFIMGSEPCENDCAIFGVLTQVLWHLPTSPYEKFVKEDCQNLVDYCERMKEKFWPDWDDCITHGGTREAKN